MIAEPKMSRRDEMESLLPFYLNGTLDGDDLARLEQWLAEDPAAATALGAAEAELIASVAGNEAVKPRADALSRFSAALDHEAAPRVSAPSALKSAWSRLTAAPAWLAWAAAAAMLALVVVETVRTPDQGEAPRVAGAGEAADQPFALIAFKPDARVEAVAAILSETGASIIDGPKPGGFFRVAIPAGDVAAYETILKRFTDSGLVDGVMPGRAP